MKNGLKYVILSLGILVILLVWVFPVQAEVISIPHEFQSVEECQHFIDANQNKLPIRLIADANGIINLNYYSNNRYNCNEYSQDWERIAYEAGYIFPRVAVQDGKIWKTQVTDQSPGSHVGNWTRIKNTYYYMESSPSIGRFRLVKVLDLIR